MNRWMWRTRDGRRLHVEQMEDGHLVSTINLLRRDVEVRRLTALAVYDAVMVRTLREDPEAANNPEILAYGDRLVDATDNDLLLWLMPQYLPMLMEAKRRDVLGRLDNHRGSFVDDWTDLGVAGAVDTCDAPCDPLSVLDEDLTF